MASEPQPPVQQPGPPLPVPRYIGDARQQLPRNEKQPSQNQQLHQRLRQQQLQKQQLQQLHLQKQQKLQQGQRLKQQLHHKRHQPQQVGGNDDLQHHKPRQKQPQPYPHPTISRARPTENFTISKWPRNDSVYRSLNAEAAIDVSYTTKTEPQTLPASRISIPVAEQHGSSSGTTTPRPAAPSSSRLELPICSSRGRAVFGEFAWAIEPAQKDGDTQATTSSAAVTAPSSTSTTSSGKNGSSLRASIFKKSGAVPYGSSPSPGGQKESEGTDKEGRPKPWHIEVPAGIPYYVVPPNRRFGGLAKGGARGFARSPSQGSQGGSASRQGNSGSQFGNTRNASGSSLGASNNNRNVGSGNNTNSNVAGLGVGTMNNRLQKSTAVRYADFNPWKGRHPEDRFSETIVRLGHYDRLQNAQSHTVETSSARSWLPLLLKQKHSTAMLGQALALANALSREKNHISAASQFKLPPRVTVTDTRRETWLRDLTNATIPLRKLSRTIPHGLRGKVLLEQCMLKSVPVDRAMWLARCVGAQELRAFKRKGSANVAALAESEVRWLKDWTLVVQQFVETFLVEVDLENGTGRERLQYAARFARQLFLERLLDHDQFLNWMLAGLRNTARLPAATSASTPYFDLWLFIVEEYYHGIMMRRKTSSHLAVTVLSRLEYLSNFQTAKLSAVQTKTLLKKMVQSHSEAFVSQSVWPRHEKTLMKMLSPAALFSAPSQPYTPLDVISSIRHRNNCLCSEKSTEMEQVLNYLRPLDNALRAPRKFSSHFAEFLCLDKKESIPFVIRWCASIHRPGLAKVYTAVRLINELCRDDARLVTGYVLDFLSSGRKTESEPKKEDNSRAALRSKSHQQHLQLVQDRQFEGSRALYQLVGLLVAQGLFLPSQYLASLILLSRPADVDEIVPQGDPHVRLVAELPVHFLDRSTASLRSNHLRRLGYDTDYETRDTEDILSQLRNVFDAIASLSPTPTTTASGDTSNLTASNSSPAAPTEPKYEKVWAQVTKLSRTIEDRGRNVKMAVADWLNKDVVTPMRMYKSASDLESGVNRKSFSKPQAEAISLNLANPANISLERANAIRCLIEKTEDLRLLSDFILALASHPQSISVMALCTDTVNLHLAAFLALGVGRALYDKVMGLSLSITIGVDSGATTEFQTLLPPGTDIRPLLLALPALAEKMPPPGPDSSTSRVKQQLLGPVPKDILLFNTSVGGENGKRHFDIGVSMSAEIRCRLLEIDQRLSVATYDADCSPLSDGRGPHVAQEDAAADEVRDEMVKIASSGGVIDNATMDRLFGTIAMISQERWRRIRPEGDSSALTRSRDDIRLSASLFTRLRRFNASHFDTIMVKWLKRLRTMRDRPAIGTLYPVFVVFGCLDLTSLMATTADEQPREPGAMIQSPARSTWRTSYLQDVLTLLSVPIADDHPTLTCDECQRFRLFQHDAPFDAPAGIAALVRNAVAEMTLWRHHQRQSSMGVLTMQPIILPRKPIDALSVSRLLRTAAVADASKAGSALAKTTDQTVRSGLWEMMTLALTRQITPGRTPLEMLRGLDIFAADVGQLALGLVVSPGPYASAIERVKEADNLASLILRAVSEFQFSSLSVMHSLPADMATSLRDHAQARFLDMVPTWTQSSSPMTATAATPAIELDNPPMPEESDFHVASGFLDIVRTIMLNQQEQFQQQLEQQHAVAPMASGSGAATSPANPQQPPSSPSVPPISCIPPLDASVVDKLGELWCLLQVPTIPAARNGHEDTDRERIVSMRHAILQQWLPALLSLILLHVPNRDALLLNIEGPSDTGISGLAAAFAAGVANKSEAKAPSQGTSPATFNSPSTSTASMGLNIASNIAAVTNNNLSVGGNANSSGGAGGGGGLGLSTTGFSRTSRDFEQESIRAGACIALASLYMEVSSLADNMEGSLSSGHRLALQSRLYDTALILADGLSDETRQQCVRALREAIASRDGADGIGGIGGGDLPPVMAYMLSSPVSASIYYPRLYLERPQMPVFGRSQPAPPPREWPQNNPGNTSENGGTPAPPSGTLKRMPSGYGGFFGVNNTDNRIKRVRFGLKTWDAVSDPSPAVQDNDTAVNLWLLDATKVVRQRRR